MKLIGITGGIGMGKSTAARWLEARGLPVVDTDELARRVVEPGQPALTEVRAAFGPDYLDGAGALRRAELARLVFADNAARRTLEAILHPRIRALWTAEAARWRARETPVACVVIPLLFETDATPEFDVTVCIACSSATQHERLRARGWSSDEIQQRSAAQWPAARKCALANYVVWSEGVLENTGEQLSRILDRVAVRR
jgi:dephospho-CoA kinase